MKTSIFKILAFVLIVFCISTSLLAQNWENLNPDGTEILADTTLLRSVIVTIAPGETIGPVTHPAHFAYILTDGKLRVHTEGREPAVMDLKKGMPIYMDPVGPHKTENVGSEPFSFLIVELKEHPYKGSD